MLVGDRKREGGGEIESELEREREEEERESLLCKKCHTLVVETKLCV